MGLALCALSDGENVCSSKCYFRNRKILSIQWKNKHIYSNIFCQIYVSYLYLIPTIWEIWNLARYGWTETYYAYVRNYFYPCVSILTLKCNMLIASWKLLCPKLQKELRARFQFMVTSTVKSLIIFVLFLSPISLGACSQLSGHLGPLSQMPSTLRSF